MRLPSRVDALSGQNAAIPDGTILRLWLTGQREDRDPLRFALGENDGVFHAARDRHILGSPEHVGDHAAANGIAQILLQQHGSARHVQCEQIALRARREIIESRWSIERNNRIEIFLGPTRGCKASLSG